MCGGNFQSFLIVNLEKDFGKSSIFNRCCIDPVYR